MNRTRVALLASITGIGVMAATPSAALFGPVCIPQITNCWCTYNVPCPVQDNAAISQYSDQLQYLQEQLQVLEQIKDPQEMIMMSLRGQGGFSIPGMGSIGIDLNGLIEGNLSSLGLPAGIDINMVRSLAEGDISTATFMNLAGAAGVDLGTLESVGLTPATLDAIASGQISPEMLLGVSGAMGITPEIAALSDSLSAIGLDEDMIGAIASGELSPQYLVELAAGAGIDVPTLDSLGLSMDNMRALAEGGLPTSEVLGLAQNLGLQANVLSNIGIDKKLIQDVAAGLADVQQIRDLAAKADLSEFDLASVGFDASTLDTLSNGLRPEQVMGLLQRTGFDKSPLTALGIDANMLGQIASGNLPPEAINLLAANAGLPASAIVVPGATGPISAPGTGGVGGGATPSQNFMTIPTSSVPGLDGVLAQARGASAGPQPEDPAMCTADNMTLISTDIPPNAYGADVTNIDMAISGGALETFPESRTAVQEANKETAAFAWARSVTAQNIVVAGLESIDAFETMLDDTTTLQGDFAVNDTIMAQLMTARAETASMLTAVISAKAAQYLNEDVLSPVPLFPQDSRFEELIDESVTQPSEAEAEAARQTRQVASDHSQFTRDASDAVHHYNLTVDAINIAAGLDDVENIILNHEKLKSMQASLEEVIQSRLAQLYADPGAAWDILLPQLYAEAGNYLDPDKYNEGFSDARALSSAVTAAATTTGFGDRLWDMVSDGEGGQERAFSTAAETPYGYEFIDSSGEPLPEAYNIVPRQAMLIGGGEEDEPYMPPGTELVGAFQYYLELVRRTQFYSELRRGDTEASMTSRFWNEMITNASRCVIGPFELTEETLMKRPEMFDLSPDCDHLTWSYGDEEDYIDSSELGGADAALWISKIALDRTQKRTGGPEKVLEDILAVIRYAEENNLTERLDELGLQGTMEDVLATIEILEATIADSSFSVSISIPVNL